MTNEAISRLMLIPAAKCSTELLLTDGPVVAHGEDRLRGWPGEDTLYRVRKRLLAEQWIQETNE